MESLISSRKAQITVFIIIGVIILISVGIYSYMRLAEVSPADILQPKAPPVVEFIDACLERVAKEAIQTMGDQGGYISVPEDIALNPSRHVDLVPGLGGTYAPKVPYWYFDGKTEIPGLEYMAVQVEEYVNQNLGYCLQNYSTLTDEYDIEELSNYSADVDFAEKDTVVGLDYKVRISPKGGGEVIDRETFQVKLDVQVKRMWNLSVELLEAENRMTF
ncbi:hypothetical protein KY363_07500, partial [Candidatus Woesearchaeota archaeon]|nr:hypothetical protein [Candidatus Woesearchaeota archaeon]